jgi:mannosyltransferase
LASVSAASAVPGARPRRVPDWWPLAAIALLAALLRFSTLGLQSFWYDEAFTPVHVLHPGLGATLRAMVHTENTPPLWYVLVWAVSRVLGTGAIALRSLSATAGLATVLVAWGIGRELAGRRVAIVLAGLVAVNPLFVWYSQEARAYSLFVFLSALAMLCFLRAEHEPSPRRLAAFAVSGSLALLSHYFAVFLLIPMVLWLLRRPQRLRATLPAAGAIAIVGLALLPLISAQGGHGTQWIGDWALSSRLQAIPQYYLTGYYGSALGHGIELLVALPILGAVGFGLWRALTPRESDGALLALAIAACGVLIPVLLVALGVDYLAPRNLVAAMIPVTALIAVIAAARSTGTIGLLLVAAIGLAFLAISIDVDLSPRLQRGDWRGVAQVLRRRAPLARRVATTASSTDSAARAIVTVELGAAPLEYYMPPQRNLRPGSTATVSEIDETGYAPLRPGAKRPPVPGFHLLSSHDVHGLVVYRFVASRPVTVSQALLRRRAITATHAEVLVPGSGPSSTGTP